MTAPNVSIISSKIPRPENHPYRLQRFIASEIIALTFLILITSLLYWHTLSVPYVLDDAHNIVANPQIRMDRLTSRALLQAGFDSPLSRRPVAYISFALNYYFGRYDPFGYHLINILIHLFNGLLLYYFVKTTLV